MNSHDSNSNEKSILNFTGDAVKGDEIIGGGKTVPIIIEPNLNVQPQGFTVLDSVTPDGNNVDYPSDPVNNTYGVDIKPV